MIRLDHDKLDIKSIKLNELDWWCSYGEDYFIAYSNGERTINVDYDEKVVEIYSGQMIDNEIECVKLTFDEFNAISELFDCFMLVD